MSSAWTEIGIVLAVFIAIAAMAIAFDRRAEVMVEDGPEDEPYQIFTREFDRVIAATDLPAILREASPDVAKGYHEKNDWKWRAQIALAEVSMVSSPSCCRWKRTRLIRCAMRPSC
ncbi:hypothetical protein [Sphingopyxis sp.]|uniref:hypothetical protein n=1 Tax=Sphingopyxis sp. TaxID=1908224 RepID=UPI001D5E3AFA|nr:hypothetical protein [Sphingopyxis sp.]MBW8297249.1 hypothetical protein [Sphingopyxis sp.]